MNRLYNNWIKDDLHDGKSLIGGGSVVREQLFPLRQRLFPFVSLTSIATNSIIE